MSNNFDATCCTQALTAVGELDDEKVSSALANFFSSNWMKARSGDVKAAVDLQHYASRAGQTGSDSEMTNKILEKMEPVAAVKLRQAIVTGNVISFEV